MLGLRRLPIEAGIEQGMGLFKLAVVHLHSAEQAKGRCVFGLQRQRLIQVFPAFIARFQPLNVGEPVAVGLAIRQVCLEHQARDLSLNRAGKMRVMMLYLHGTPRYQPISDAAKVCSFLTVCRGLREL